MLVHQTYCFPDVLLPVNKGVDFSKAGEAIKVCNTISGMYGFAIRALESLKNGELTAFDSLATDCSCHLRALRIAAIAQNLFAKDSLLKENLELVLQDLKAKQAILRGVGPDLSTWCQKGKQMSGFLTPIVSAIKTLQSDHKSNSYCFTIQDALAKLEVKTEIDLELIYVIHAYILTLVKDYKAVEKKDNVMCAHKSCGQILDLHHHVFKEVTIEKKLSDCLKKWESPTINMNLIEKDVYRLAKKNLTNLSVQFLLKETQKLKDSDIYSILSQSQKTVEGKIELPDFYSLTGTFQVCLQKQIPILLKLKKCVHAHRYQEPETPSDIALYLSPQNGKHFVITPFDQKWVDGPVVVVEGKRSGKLVEKELTSVYLERLLKDFDFMHICELDGAQHKQYTSDADSFQQKPSEVIAILKEPKYNFEAQRLDALKEEAQEKGCAFYNQSLLILSHIFADRLSNQQAELDLCASIATSTSNEDGLNFKEEFKEDKSRGAQ